MISEADVRKLTEIHAPGSQVLSLYLRIPASLPSLRELPGRAEELLAAAAAGAGRRVTATARSEQRRAVRRFLEVRARDWQGPAAAIFTCRDAGLAEAFPLPCPVADRAVLAPRPHVRPLLAALERCPAYYVAVTGRDGTWVFRVAGTRIDALAQLAGSGPDGPRPGGWHALGPHRSRERITKLGRYPQPGTAALLSRLLRAAGLPPLVIGGDDEPARAFAALLPDDVRGQLAGSFTAKPAALTPARARVLAAEVIGEWVRERERRLAALIVQEPAGGLGAVGLDACLAAVSSRAVSILAVPDADLLPGFACDLCGRLSVTPGACRHGSLGVRPVPDLLEEMTAATLADGGDVATVRDCPGEVAALLRFPLAQSLRAS
jgi:hypothetical protein